MPVVATGHAERHLPSADSKSVSSTWLLRLRFARLPCVLACQHSHSESVSFPHRRRTYPRLRELVGARSPSAFSMRAVGRAVVANARQYHVIRSRVRASASRSDRPSCCSVPVKTFQVRCGVDKQYSCVKSWSLFFLLTGLPPCSQGLPRRSPMSRRHQHGARLASGPSGELYLSPFDFCTSQAFPLQLCDNFSGGA